MKEKFTQILRTWPKRYITFRDISSYLNRSDATCYGQINRAIKQRVLIPLRRGIYLISFEDIEKKVNLYEVAQMIFGPSFISLESALQFHNLIPEGVFSTISVTTKRSKEFSTPIGLFVYRRIPLKHFLAGVERFEQGSACFFIAHPWRAIADLIYLNKKNWCDYNAMCVDLRIDHDLLLEDNTSLLQELEQKYPNIRTRKILKKLKETIS